MWCRRLGLGLGSGVGPWVGLGLGVSAFRFRPSLAQTKDDNGGMSGVAYELSQLLHADGVRHAFGGSFAWKQHVSEFRTPGDMDLYVRHQDLNDLKLYRTLCRFDVEDASNLKIGHNGIWAIARAFRKTDESESFADRIHRMGLDLRMGLHSIFSLPYFSVELREAYGDSGYSMKLNGVKLDLIYSRPNFFSSADLPDIQEENDIQKERNNIPLIALETLVLSKLLAFRVKDQEDLHGALPRISTRVNWERIKTRLQSSPRIDSESSLKRRLDLIPYTSQNASRIPH